MPCNERIFAVSIRLTAAAAVLWQLPGCSTGVSDSPRPTAALDRPAPSPFASRGDGRSPTGTYKVGQPYRIGATWYVPREQPDYDTTGMASWYGDDFHGRLTANGEVYDMNDLTAAHPTLPLPSLVRVENLRNGRSVVVRVNDRGPFVGGRIIDLSRAAADKLGFYTLGTAPVRVTYAGRAPLHRQPG